MKEAQLVKGWPREMDIRSRPEVYISQLEARIKELEANAEAFAKYIDEACAEFERLRQIIEALTTRIKDAEYAAWEDRNGWDI